MVDVTVKLEEQNRNQLTFGAGISQYEGFFGQLAFQTSNFLGRGETLLGVGPGRRARAGTIQVGFTEPYPVRSQHHRRRRRAQARAAVRRLLHAEVDWRQPHVRCAARRRSRAPSSTTPTKRSGITRPQRSADRHRRASSSAAGLLDHLVAERSVAADADAARRCFAAIRSSTTRCSSGRVATGPSARSSPTLVHNTVDHPIFPTTGQEVHGGGGSGRARRQHAVHQAARSKGSGSSATPAGPSIGFRGLVRIHHARCATRSRCPIFERLFLGGEYSIRGFDIRSIGPTVPELAGGARRQQEPGVQRRVPDHDRRAGAPGAVLRRRAGARLRRAVRLEAKT